MDISHIKDGTTTVCIVCGVVTTRDKYGKTKYCKPCARKRNNKKKKYSERTPFEKLKHNTRRESLSIVKCGLAEKKPCDVCGNPKSEIHHDDYHDAWHFRWMCKKCHTQYHQMLKLIPSMDTTKIYKAG